MRLERSYLAKLESNELSLILMVSKVDNAALVDSEQRAGLKLLQMSYECEISGWNIQLIVKKVEQTLQLISTWKCSTLNTYTPDQYVAIGLISKGIN